MTDRLLLREVELAGRVVGDCRVREGFVTELAPTLKAAAGEEVLDGQGGALLPGFADHHLHLAAMAAARDSFDVTGLGRDELADALAPRAAKGGWVRVIGYDDQRHGRLDRDVLDQWAPDAPVRVQHRSGALWVLNSAALARLPTEHHPGLETDPTGRPTGRLWRADAWLRRATASDAPDLGAVSRDLAAAGFTHVTDATPEEATGRLVGEAVRSGAVAQHVMLLSSGATADHPRLRVGPLKIVVPDHELPSLDDLAAAIASGHASGRGVAVHCVTREALALTLAALDVAGSHDGDRIEHCSVAGPEAAREVARRGLRVVTQPGLVLSRGDDYLDRVAAEDIPDLWPYATLLEAGVPVAPSSDAPYGDPDPWPTLRAATARLTRSGRVLGTRERVPAETVLAGLLSSLEDPGGPPRQVAVGAAADLVLLDRPLGEALREATAEARVTTVLGRVVHAS